MRKKLREDSRLIILKIALFQIKKKNRPGEFAHCFIQKKKFGNCKTPLQIIFCVKHYNKRKLNTHLWFFGGFCNEFQPKYTILLDVGTKPLPKSLFYLYDALISDPNLAGCCGEIVPMAPDYKKIVVPAQVIEYKFAHMLDKAMESVVGFITVLPGAFSAYRWEALSQGTNPNDPSSIQGSPLWEDYFKSICHPEAMDNFSSNIYLAEDRVLCLSLFTKRNEAYTLRYVRKSVAETDVPDSITDLMAQRRRWINGSWFALIDSLMKCNKVFQSSHSPCRKAAYIMQMTYYSIVVICSWFIVGAYCLAVRIAISLQFQSFVSSLMSQIGEVVFLVYLGMLAFLVLASLSSKPKAVEAMLKAVVGIMAVYQLYILGVAIWLVVVHNLTFVSLGLAITAGGFMLTVILNGAVMTVMLGFPYYILLIPTYVNIFFTYAICNIHDCTWGNRPDTLTADEIQRLGEFEESRAKWVIMWTFSNSLFNYAILSIKDNSAYEYYLFGIIGINLGLLFMRVAGGVIYVLHECCKKSGKIQNLSLESVIPIKISISEANPLRCSGEQSTPVIFTGHLRNSRRAYRLDIMN